MIFFIKNILLILIFSFIIFGLMGNFTFAAGLVPCGPGIGKDCTTCDFYKLIDNIIKFISVDIAPALALALIVIGAIVMMTSAGSETKYDKGKQIITMAIVGIFIIWGSWLMIDTLMKAFPNVGKEFGPWNEIKCN